ncbi:TPA: hypothetical protein RQK97_002552 [Vibrio vulnificus]|nr:hypothetical protein [Vibrio vulnificus]HDZ3713060.1 hypothetical protein [Vibrio vulnificus]
MHKLLYKLIILACVFLSSLSKADSDNMFEKKLIHLCPEIKGQLLDGATPLQGVTLERGVAYGELLLDSTVTDDEGYFFFAASEYESRKPVNPLTETRVVRYLSASLNDQIIKIFYSPISTTTPIEKVTHSFSNLVCDVNAPLKTFNVKHGENNSIAQELYTICDLELLECIRKAR